MGDLTRRLWPDGTTWPVARLALGIVLAPALSTLVVAAVAFIIAGFTESTQIGVMAVTQNAAVTFLALAVTLSVVAVLPGIAVLWAMRERRLIAWCATGLVAGGAAGAVLALVEQADVTFSIVMGTCLGIVLLLTVRWVAGIRNG